MEEIKQGYKQTDIGLIPEDWEVVTLGEISSYQGGSQPDISFFSSRKYNGYIRLIQIRDYKTDKYAVYIPEKLARRKCTKDDVMIGRYGPPIFQILKGIEGAYNVALIKSIPTQTVDKSFFYYTLKRDDLFQLIELLSRRSSGQTGVDLIGLKSFKIGLPHKSEQTAIAAALSDTDALISALDKKITKKQQIKQGAMQQLLTGKKRLAGFNGENKYKETEIGLIPEDWGVIKVEEAFRFLSTASFSRDQLGSEGNVHCLHYGDIHTKYDEFIDFNFVELPKVIGKRGLNYPLLLDGDIIMADASEDYTGLCKSVEIKNIGNKKVISGLHTILLRDRNNVFENGFKGYLFEINEVRKQLIELSTGMKVFGVSKKNLEQVFIPVPTKPEQTAIAQILTEMDQEIAQLEKKRDKYVQLKAGMMQVLLTGKVRLVNQLTTSISDQESKVIETDLTQPKAKKHSKEFDEAVIISFLVDKFGTKEEPLSRFLYTKYSYLLHRKQDHSTSDFQKFAAGPYNPKSRYKGPEKIGHENRYFEQLKNDDGFDVFVPSENIHGALAYFDQWYGRDIQLWIEQFRNTAPWDLETLTTVDMAVVDLEEKNIEISVVNIKTYLASIPKWKAKLGKPQFADFKIQQAIIKSKELFSQ